METNLRRVRFTGQRWTILSEADQKKALSLCDYCALQDSCLTTRRMDELLAEFGLVANISECPVYQPVVPFRKPLLGLDGDFNTFRLGAAWARRVKVGAPVALYDAADEVVFGTAEVTAVTVGPFQDVAPRHARFNHMMLDKSADLAPELLWKVMVNSYGSTFMTRERPCSVIYLRRIHEERP